MPVRTVHLSLLAVQAARKWRAGDIFRNRKLRAGHGAAAAIKSLGDRYAPTSVQEKAIFSDAR